MPLTLEELVFLNEKNEKLPFCEEVVKNYTYIPPLESIPGFKEKLDDIKKRESETTFLVRGETGVEERTDYFWEERYNLKVEYTEKAKESPFCSYRQSAGRSILVQALIDQKVPLFGIQRIKFKEIPGVHSLFNITKEEEESGELFTIPIFILFDYLLYLNFNQIYGFNKASSVDIRPGIPLYIRRMGCKFDTYQVDYHLASAMLLIVNNFRDGFCEMKHYSNNNVFFTKPSKGIERDITLRLPNFEEFQKKVEGVYLQDKVFVNNQLTKEGSRMFLAVDEVMMLDCGYRLATPDVHPKPKPKKEDGTHVIQFLKNHSSVNPIVVFYSSEFLYYEYFPREPIGEKRS